MPDLDELGRAIAGTLAAAPWQKSMEVDVHRLSAPEVADLLDAIATACASEGVGLKGVAVDAALVTMPANPPFVNAFHRNRLLVVIDLTLDGVLVVKRT